MAPTTAMDKARKAVSVAASIAASAVVARTFVNEFLPYPVQDYVHSSLSSLVSRFFSRSSDDLTLVIEQFEGYAPNELYDAAAAYLGGKVSPSIHRLRIFKQESDKSMLVTVDSGEQVTDEFGGTQFLWCPSVRQRPARASGEEGPEVKVLELTFHRKHKDVAFDAYLPHITQMWKEMKEGEKPLKLHMLRYECWNPVNLDHPATFETLAMEPELKRVVVEDLERFVRRREYYRRVGKAWKRGYLLYGPPGTGKSSLIAAMANFLKFDVYDLELTEVLDNTALRTVLVATSNRSILVVEDVDCSIQLQNREAEDDDGNQQQGGGSGRGRLTLSGVLNFMDGLWSSCGDERVIVFTTNHRERLDSALLRPGRMDLHIHMSYCSPAGFRTLAANYHCVDDHRLFPEIDRLIGEEVDVSPAEVTGELMKSDDVDGAMAGLVEFLKAKKGDPARRKGREEKKSGENGAEEEKRSCTKEKGGNGAEMNGSCTEEEEPKGYGQRQESAGQANGDDSLFGKALLSEFPFV